MPLVAVIQGSPAQTPAAPDPPGQAASPTSSAAGGGTSVLQDVRDGVRDAIQEGAQTEAVVVQNPPYRQEEQIPKEVIPILGIVFGSLVAIVLGYPVVRLVTRLIEKAADKTLLRASDVTEQLKVLQNSVDTMAIEIERISESQRFQDRLLAEREPVRLPESRGGA